MHTIRHRRLRRAATEASSLSPSLWRSPSTPRRSLPSPLAAMRDINFPKSRTHTTINACIQWHRCCDSFCQIDCLFPFLFLSCRYRHLATRTWYALLWSSSLLFPIVATRPLIMHRETAIHPLKMNSRSTWDADAFLSVDCNADNAWFSVIHDCPWLSVCHVW